MFDKLLRNRVVKSRGIDVVSVYSIKYVPAVNRSACCPHRVMIIRVGINVASNITYIRVNVYAVNVSVMNN